MASKGQSFNQSAIVALKPEEVSQSLIATSAGVPGYSVTTAGVGSIVLTRRYVPQWAIAVAIVGVLLFLVGLLALLVKENETVTVTLLPSGEGTKILMSGTANSEMRQRLTSWLSGMMTLTPTTPAISPASDEISKSLATGQASNPARFEQLAKFAELRDKGVLTEEEFQAEKDRILNP